jgi:hypothetical protein
MGNTLRTSRTIEKLMRTLWELVGNTLRTKKNKKNHHAKI